MTKLGDMTNAPIELEHGGTTYYLSTLRLDEQGELDLWLEQFAIERCRRLLKMMGEGASQEVKDQMWLKAAEEAKDQLTIIDAIGSAAGIRKMVFLSLRVKHPDITDEVVTAMCTPDRLLEIKDKLDRIAGLERGEPSAEGNESRPSTNQ